MAADRITKAYEALEPKFELGSIAEFREAMSDPKNRSKAWSALSEDWDVGDEAEFDKAIADDYNAWKTEQTNAKNPNVPTMPGMQMLAGAPADQRRVAAPSAEQVNAKAPNPNVPTMPGMQMLAGTPADQRRVATANPADSLKQAPNIQPQVMDSVAPAQADSTKVTPQQAPTTRPAQRQEEKPVAAADVEQPTSGPARTTPVARNPTLPSTAEQITQGTQNIGTDTKEALAQNIQERTKKPQWQQDYEDKNFVKLPQIGKQWSDEDKRQYETARLQFQAAHPNLSGAELETAFTNWIFGTQRQKAAGNSMETRTPDQAIADANKGIIKAASITWNGKQYANNTIGQMQLKRDAESLDNARAMREAKSAAPIIDKMAARYTDLLGRIREKVSARQEARRNASAGADFMADPETMRARALGQAIDFEAEMKQETDIPELVNQLFENMSQEELSAAVEQYEAKLPANMDALERYKKAAQAFSDDVYKRIIAQEKDASMPKGEWDYLFRSYLSGLLGVNAFHGITTWMSGASGQREQVQDAAMAEADQLLSEQHGMWHTVGSIGASVAALMTEAGVGTFGVGEKLAEGTIRGGVWVAGKLAAKKATTKAGEAVAKNMVVSAAGRSVMAAAYKGGMSFSLYDVGQTAAGELRTGTWGAEENKGSLLKSSIKGFVLGGTVSLLGNTVKGATEGASRTTKALADAGAMAGEVGIFSAEPIYELAKEGQLNKQNGLAVVGQNLGVILGMKGSHVVMHPKDFLSNLRRRYADADATKIDVNSRLNAAEQAEWDAAVAENPALAKFGAYLNAAEELATGKKDKARRSTENATAIELDEATAREFELREQFGMLTEGEVYDAMQRMLDDANLSTSTKAKVFAKMTGRTIEAPTIMGAGLTQENGKWTVTTTDIHGNKIQPAQYATEADAKKAFDVALRQAQENTIVVSSQLANSNAQAAALRAAAEAAAGGNQEAASNMMFRYGEISSKPIDEWTPEEHILMRQMEYDGAGQMKAEQTASYIQNEVEQRHGVNLRAIADKLPSERTAKENQALQDFMQQLDDAANRPGPKMIEETTTKAEGTVDGERVELTSQPETDENGQPVNPDETVYVKQEDGTVEATTADKVSDVEKVTPESTAEKAEAVTLTPEERENVQKKPGDPDYIPTEKPYWAPEEPAAPEAVTPEGPAKAAQEPVNEATAAPETVTPEEPGNVQQEPNVPTGKAGEKADLADAIALNNLDEAAAEAVMMAPDDYAELVETYEGQRQQAHDYAEGKTEEKPDNYEYWAQRDGLGKETEAPAAPETVASEEPANVQEEPGNVQKEAENVQKEPGNVQQEPVNVQKEPVNEAPAAPETEAPEEPAKAGETALERVPKDEKGEPRYEAAEPTDAYDALVEQTEGDEAMAQEVVKVSVAQAEHELAVTERQRVNMSGTPAQMIAAQKEHKQAVAAAQAKVDAWKAIAAVPVTREAEVRAKEAEKAARQSAANTAAIKAAQAAKEAEREGAGSEGAEVGEAITKKWAEAKKEYGYPTTFIAPNGQRFKGRYVMSEAGAATASHDPFYNFQPSVGYPVAKGGETSNQRDYYSDKQAQASARMKAANYDGRALQEVPIVDRGAIISGSERTIAGQIAAANKTDGQYISDLRDAAQRFGYTPEQIAGFEHPRVQIELDEPIPFTVEMSRLFNQSTTKTQNPVEATIALGKNISSDLYGRLLKLMEPFADADKFLDSEAALREAVKELNHAGVVLDQEMMQYLSDRGLPTAAARELVKNVLIGKAFEGNSEVVKILAERRNLGRAVMTALQAISENNRLGNYSLNEELAQAIRLADEALSAGGKPGQPVSWEAGQMSMFAEPGKELTFTDALVLALGDVVNSGNFADLKKVLTMYNAEAIPASAGQADLFSGGVKTKEEILREQIASLKNPEEVAARLKEIAAQRAIKAGNGPLDKQPIKPDNNGQEKGNERRNSENEIRTVPAGTPETGGSQGTRRGTESQGTGEGRGRGIKTSVGGPTREAAAQARAAVGKKLQAVRNMLGKTVEDRKLGAILDEMQGRIDRGEVKGEDLPKYAAALDTIAAEVAKQKASENRVKREAMATLGLEAAPKDEIADLDKKMGEAKTAVEYATLLAEKDEAVRELCNELMPETKVYMTAQHLANDESVSPRLRKAVQDAIDKGKKVNALVDSDDNVYIISEAASAGSGATGVGAMLVHETQHIANDTNGLVEKVAANIPLDELKAVVKELTGDGAVAFYQEKFGDNAKLWADEAVAFAMQRKVTTGEASSANETFNNLIDKEYERRIEENDGNNLFGNIRNSNGTVRNQTRAAGSREEISGRGERAEHRRGNADGDGRGRPEGSQEVQRIAETAEEQAAQVDAVAAGKIDRVVNKDGETIVEHVSEPGKTVARFNVMTWHSPGPEGKSGRQLFLEYMAKQGRQEEGEQYAKLMDMWADDFIRIANEEGFDRAVEWAMSAPLLNKAGKAIFSPIKPNGEYPFNTDFGSSCVRRDALDAFTHVLSQLNMFAMVEDSGGLMTRVMTKLLQERGFQVACVQCFVDARRQNTWNVATTFTQLYNSVLATLVEDTPLEDRVDHSNFSGVPSIPRLLNGIDKTDVMPADDYQIWLRDKSAAVGNWKAIDKILHNKNGKNGTVKKDVAWKIANDIVADPEMRRWADPTDYMDTKSFDAVKIASPKMLSLYNQKKGTGGPKAAFGYAPWNSNILTNDAYSVNAQTKKWEAKTLWLGGGGRTNSFADFVPELFFDYAQRTAELAAIKGPMQSYTKEPAYVRAFGMTGEKINMSLIPDVIERYGKDGKVDEIETMKNAGLDENGSLIFAVNKPGRPAQTFPYEEALKIQNDIRYYKNCGTVTIGVSDKQIWVAMKNHHNIRMIIPFHKSANPAINMVTNGIHRTRDYTSHQNTRVWLPDDKGKMAWRTADGSAQFAWDLYRTIEARKDKWAAEHPEADREDAPLDFIGIVNEYVDYCEAHEAIPKFEMFVYDVECERNVNGDLVPIEDENGNFILKRDENGKPVRNPDYYTVLADWCMRVVNPETGEFEFAPQKSVKMNFPKELNEIMRDAMAARKAQIDRIEAEIAGSSIDDPNSLVRQFKEKMDLANSGPEGAQEVADWLGIGELGKAAQKEANFFEAAKKEAENRVKRAQDKLKPISKLHDELWYQALEAQGISTENYRKKAEVLPLVDMYRDLVESGDLNEAIELLKAKAKKKKFEEKDGMLKAGYVIKDPGITYDDNGELIPYDMRYDKRRKDVRFMVLGDDSARPEFDGDIVGYVEKKLEAKEKLEAEALSVVPDAKIYNALLLSTPAFVKLSRGAHKLKTLKGSTIARGRWGVGKDIDASAYVHKDYAAAVVPEATLKKAMELVPKDFKYNCIMYPYKKAPEVVRFDEAPGFDTLREPAVGNFVKVNTATGEITRGNSDYIWHHKWLWVGDNYKGFDVQEAVNWSKTWLEKITSPSGIQAKWDAELEANGLSTDEKAPRFMVSGQEDKARDKEYDKLVKGGNEEEARKMLAEAAKANGYTIEAYHGTGRADRVGNVFRPERATSGPMAMFTSDKKVGESYSKNKADTSLAYSYNDDGSFANKLRVRTDKQEYGKGKRIGDLWYDIPYEKRAELAERASHITMDYDGNIIYDENTDNGTGNFRWNLQQEHGNVVSALIEEWLNSGNLYRHDDRIVEVLEKAGINDEIRKFGLGEPYYVDPGYRDEKVYHVYLKMQNPFDATKADMGFVRGVENWYYNNPKKYKKPSREADWWDKRSYDIDRWVSRIEEDIAKGTTEAWTAIPDYVTDYLKSMGYDGIIDNGGKYTNYEHKVYIPFESTQVKSADLEVKSNSGKTIPLSKRYNDEKKDIRYMVSGEVDKVHPGWQDEMGVVSDQLGGRHSTQIKSTRVTYENIGNFLSESGQGDAKILDASSGLGLGTKDLKMRGFDVVDVEPFPGARLSKEEAEKYGFKPATDAQYKQAKEDGLERPDFVLYDEAIEDKKKNGTHYDWIISNAVWNVIPDDWRATNLHQIEQLADVGTKVYVNTLSKDYVKGLKNGEVLGNPQEALVIASVKKQPMVRSYQHGFSTKQLEEWVKDNSTAVWKIEPASKKNIGEAPTGSAIVMTMVEPPKAGGYEPEAKGLRITPAMREAMEILGLADRLPKDEASGKDPRFMFIGEKGASRLDKKREATELLEDLKIARRMERGKRDAASIKLATGWERGTDGKWRYELNDFNIQDKKLEEAYEQFYEPRREEYETLQRMIANGDNTWDDTKRFNAIARELNKFHRENETQFGELENFVKDTELFDAYPGLRTVTVQFAQLPSGTLGSFNPHAREIVINSMHRMNMHSILVHEIQHIIQHAEGFARGGDEWSARRDMQERHDSLASSRADRDMYIESMRDVMTSMAKLELAERWMKHPNTFLKSMDRFKVGGMWSTKGEVVEEGQKLAAEYYMDAVDNLERAARWYFPDMEIGDYGSATTPEEKMKQISSIMTDLKELRKRFKAGAKGTDFVADNKEQDRLEKLLKEMSGHELYQLLAGEVEARNAQRRIGMTAAERRATLAEMTEKDDVSRDMQFVIFDGLDWDYNKQAEKQDKGIRFMVSGKTPEERREARERAMEERLNKWQDMVEARGGQVTEIDEASTNSIVEARENAKKVMDTEVWNGATGGLTKITSEAVNGLLASARGSIKKDVIAMVENLPTLLGYAADGGSRLLAGKRQDMYTSVVRIGRKMFNLNFVVQDGQTESIAISPFVADRNAERREAERARMQAKVDALYEKLAAARREVGDNAGELKRNIIAAADALRNLIKETTSSEVAYEMKRGEIKLLLDLTRKAEEAGDVNKLEWPVQRATEIVNRVNTRQLLMELDDLLKTKLDKLDTKGVEVAAYVDDQTRLILKDVRKGYRSLMHTDYDRAIFDLMVQKRLLEQQIHDAKVKGQPTGMLDIDLKNTVSGIADLKERQDKARGENINLTRESLERERLNLSDEVDAALAEGREPERATAAKLVALPIMEQLVSIREQMRAAADYRKKLKAELEKPAAERDKTAIEEWRRLASQIDADVISDIERTNVAIREFIETGHGALKEFMEAKAEREIEIKREAIAAVTHEGLKEKSIMEAQDNNGYFAKFGKLALRGAAQGLNSAEFLLSYIESHNAPTRQGTLYKRFVPQIIKAEQQLADRMDSYRKEVKAAIDKYIPGGLKTRNDARPITLTKRDENGDIIWKGSVNMSKGQALYTYMVAQMEDGRQDLAAMGFDDAAIKQVMQHIGEDYIAFAKWVADDFFPRLRSEMYNPVYEQKFGISMPKTEHYVPLRRSKKDVRRNDELEAASNLGAPTGTPGNIIKRQRNSVPVDIATDAFEMIEQYGATMEEWAAFAQAREDVQTLLNTNPFMNRLDSRAGDRLMGDTGRHLSDTFSTAMKVAVRLWREDLGQRDMHDFLMKVNKTIAGGAIAFRMNTALKQSLSIPAFFGYSLNPEFQRLLLKNLVPLVPMHGKDTYGNINWALKNLPLFRQRAARADMGEVILSRQGWKVTDQISKAGMLPNMLMDLWACAAGARAVYEYTYEKALKRINEELVLSELTPEEQEKETKRQAHNLAVAEADLVYNLSQQSSVPLMLAPIQASGGFLNSTLTMFRNASMAYARNFTGAALDARYALQHSDLSGAKRAKIAAKSAWGLALYGSVLPGLWSLGAYGMTAIVQAMWAAVMGEDDETPKSDIEWRKSYLQGTVTSPAQGMPGPAQVLDAAMNGRAYEPIMLLSENAKYKQDLKDVQDAYNNNGVMSAGLALALLKLAGKGTARNVFAVDMNTFTNMIYAVDMAARDGISPVAYGKFMNEPLTGRDDVARRYYLKRDDNLYDYVEHRAAVRNHLIANEELRERGIWARTFGRDLVSAKEAAGYIDEWASWRMPEVVEAMEVETKKQAELDAIAGDSRLTEKERDEQTAAVKAKYKDYVYSNDTVAQQAKSLAAVKLLWKDDPALAAAAMQDMERGIAIDKAWKEEHGVKAKKKPTPVRK